MKQLLQNVSSGDITLEDVPPPARQDGALLVATRFSLLSAGTERAVMELGQKSLAGKARARPDLVRKVVDAAREEGVAATVAKVRGRLADPNALGYSACGVVLEAPEDSPAAPGDLVACAGAGYAVHAEIANVPRHLCALVPDGVAPEDAAYGTVTAIALHGVRLAEVTLGDVVAVVGLGLIGQLAMDLVAAAGGVAVGLDPDEGRVELARAAGHQAVADPGDLETETARHGGGRGADAVLVTAASRDAAPLAAGIAAARERATVCVVGDVRIESPRAPLFEKELRLVVSRSYGPGRYDPQYEERGIDYPAAYVRWTEGRNLEEAVRLMAAGRLRPSRLTTHTFDLSEGERAYELLAGSEPSVGILLRYPEPGGGRTELRPAAQALRPAGRRRRASSDRVRLGVVGAGTFARGVLLPILGKQADIVGVATATGSSAKSSAERYGARVATTDPGDLLEGEGVDAVVIATRHDTHADYAARALAAGKHVFLEKPLALDRDQLERVEKAAAEGDTVLMVGFNRRFAPLALALRAGLGGRGPLVISYRLNAGRLPRSHWVHDPDIGGGRIVGEVCHQVDLASFIAGSRPVSVTAAGVRGSSEPRDDNVSVVIALADGSVASIVYTSLGDPSLPKERIEVVGEAGAAVLDDFRRLDLHRQGSVETTKSRRDKGHAAELSAFLDACRTGRQPWPVSDMLAVTAATFDIRESLRRLPPAAA